MCAGMGILTGGLERNWSFGFGGSVTKPWATIQQIDSTASMAQKGVTEPLFSMAGLFFLFVQCLRTSKVGHGAFD